MNEGKHAIQGASKRSHVEAIYDINGERLWQKEVRKKAMI